MDGLRGVAALVVVFHHALLVVPELAAPYMTGFESVSGLYFWLLYSPLHVGWAGTEAVYVFFVLSGFVLARSVMRSSQFDWIAYFPSRLVRLYLPVVGAVAFAAATIAIVPRVGQVSSWVSFHPATYTVTTILQDLVLIDGTSNVVSPLWSLQWEVLFSLLLPAIVVVARGRWFAVTVVLALTLTTIGFFTGVLFVAFMPMFVIGVALAYHWGYVESASARIAQRRSGAFIWLAVVGSSAVMLCSYWLLYPIAANSTLLIPLTRPIVVVGAVLLVIAAAMWAPLKALLSRRLFQWLGLISFSLYLVHEPVIVALAYLIDDPRWVVLIGIALACAFAVGFFFLIERPSHRLARTLHRSLGRYGSTAHESKA